MKITFGFEAFKNPQYYLKIPIKSVFDRIQTFTNISDDANRSLSIGQVQI
jgi:hypothetical protein